MAPSSWRRNLHCAFRIFISHRSGPTFRYGPDCVRPPGRYGLIGDPVESRSVLQDSFRADSSEFYWYPDKLRKEIRLNITFEGESGNSVLIPSPGKCSEEDIVDCFAIEAALQRASVEIQTGKVKNLGQLDFLLSMNETQPLSLKAFKKPLLFGELSLSSGVTDDVSFTNKWYAYLAEKKEENLVPGMELLMEVEPIVLS